MPAQEQSTYKFSEQKQLPFEELDRLFVVIGWKPRGQEKWQEVMKKSGHVITVDIERQIVFDKVAEFLDQTTAKE